MDQHSRGLSTEAAPSDNVNHEEDSPEAFEYSDLVLSFINESLMEERANELLAQSDGKPNAVEFRKRKNDGDIQERHTDEVVGYNESPPRSDMTERLLLYRQQEGPSHKLKARREALSGTREIRGGKGFNMKHKGPKEVVNIMNMLTTCAQSLAVDDRRNAKEMIKQIRQHSSPFGDGNQRLAHYFVDCLEARLLGLGSKIYRAFNRETSAVNILKAYHLYLAVTPFVRIGNFVTIKTIVDLAKYSRKLHVIDFGIYHGFQWHILIKQLSARYGGPPILKITGIEFPKPGLNPAEHVEDTGRRLAEYAASFRVPFMFSAIAKNWQDIQVQDIQIDRDDDEVLVVNCSNRFENMSDEIVSVESPRDISLKFVRRLEPDIFVQRIVNGAYGSPFFSTRFREVLFHFSALFDMLEATVPRENPDRLLIERQIFGRIVMNVIACEGSDRVERPEVYNVWKLRNLRSGFKQVHFDPKIVDRAIEHVRSCYHKDFSIDEDSKWLLQGWKGRIMYAISAWKA